MLRVKALNPRNGGGVGLLYTRRLDLHHFSHSSLLKNPEARLAGKRWVYENDAKSPDACIRLTMFALLEMVRGRLRGAEQPRQSQPRPLLAPQRQPQRIRQSTRSRHLAQEIVEDFEAALAQSPLPELAGTAAGVPAAGGLGSPTGRRCAPPSGQGAVETVSVSDRTNGEGEFGVLASCCRG